MCHKISMLLEKDLLPPFFADDNLQHLIPFQAELMDFFKRVALSLWQNFPKNAYDFGSTISRVVDNVTSSSDLRQRVSVWVSHSSHLVSEAHRTLSEWLGHWKHGFLYSVRQTEALAGLEENYNFVSSYEAYHVSHLNL